MVAIKRRLYVILVSNRSLGHKIPHVVFIVPNLHSRMKVLRNDIKVNILVLN